MFEFIPLNFDVSLCTGFQILAALNGKCRFLFVNKRYQQMQKIPIIGMPTILYRLSMIGILPALKLSCELSAKVDSTVKLERQSNYTHLFA